MNIFIPLLRFYTIYWLYKNKYGPFCADLTKILSSFDQLHLMCLVYVEATEKIQRSLWVFYLFIFFSDKSCATGNILCLLMEQT